MLLLKDWVACSGGFAGLEDLVSEEEGSLARDIL